MAGARQARGFFVSLEGGEGSGKSTQARLLGDALTARGLASLITREPGGSPGAESIRDLLVNGPPERWSVLAEALLFHAARAEHLAQTIRPALQAGTIVVCDRFADSTTVYQGHARGLRADFVAALNSEIVGPTWPDVTFILDLPVASGLARAGRRGGAQRFEQFDQTFHERLRDGYRLLAAREPGRCVLIDANREADAIHADILAVVLKRLAAHKGA